MLFSGSYMWSISREPFTRFSFPSSSLENSSTTRRIVHGGLGVGSVVAWTNMSCPNLLANSLSKPSNYLSGVLTYYLDISCSSCSSHQSSYPTLTVSMLHFSVRHSHQQIMPFTDCDSHLVWLRPLKQICAPLFSIKQKKLRCRIVSASCYGK